MKMNRISMPLATLAVAVLATLSGCDAMDGFFNDSSGEEQNKAAENTGANPDEAEISSWETYVNGEYRFQLKHPSDFKLKEATSPSPAISFSKNGKEAWVIISPEGGVAGRPIEAPLESEQVISGKKAFVEEWNVGTGGKGKFLLYRFMDPVEDWKLCGESEYCYHIELVAPVEDDVETARKILSTFEFIQKE